jgi:ParB-like nuclease family protein
VPSASKPRRALEDRQAAAAVHRRVHDRVADQIALQQVREPLRNRRQKIDGLDELAASLNQDGLPQPVVVRRVNGAYELIARDRRLAAASDCDDESGSRSTDNQSRFARVQCGGGPSQITSAERRVDVV